MTAPKPARVTPTEEQRQWASGCVDAYRVSGTIEDVIAEGLVTRDRDVRRKMLVELRKYVAINGPVHDCELESMIEEIDHAD